MHPEFNASCLSRGFKVRNEVSLDLLWPHTRYPYVKIGKSCIAGEISGEEFESFSFLFNFRRAACKKLFNEFDISGDQVTTTLSFETRDNRFGWHISKPIYCIQRYIGYFSNIGYRYQLSFDRYKWDIGCMCHNIGYRFGARILDIRYRLQTTDMPSLIKSYKS